VHNLTRIRLHVQFHLFSSSLPQTGTVYAVEFSHRPGRELINCAKKRTNIIPIVEDARYPLKYRMLVGMVDCIFADVAQPDQVGVLYATLASAMSIVINLPMLSNTLSLCILSILSFLNLIRRVSSATTRRTS
jgi:hypothetical protein